MEHRRIKMSDIVIGQPLPWDVYDSAAKLLLRKGHVIDREQQIEALLLRGLFVDAQTLQRKETASAQVKERPSVVHLINLANKRLARLLFNLEDEEGVQEKILEVAQAIAYAAAINADIALACILLNREAGSYPIRHCVDTALVSLLVASALKKGPDEIQALTAAALTMNIGMLSHQERFQEIPRNAKIISIADRYCARVSERNYRKTLLPNAALHDILEAEKSDIDPALATAFIRELGIYPTGSFVKLEDGELAVVSGKGSSTTAPIVHALIGPRGAQLSFPIKRDTSVQLHSIREALREEQVNIRFSMQQVWGADASL